MSFKNCKAVFEAPCIVERKNVEVIVVFSLNNSVIRLEI
jgi:hypothetical protein